MAAVPKQNSNTNLDMVRNGKNIYSYSHDCIYDKGGEKMEEWQKDKYLMIARLPRMERRIKEAEAAIRQAVETSSNPAVSFSFGKDSLVCVDIATKIKPDILIINIDRGKGGDLEEAVEMYDKYAKQQGWNYHRVKTPRELLDIYKEAGSITKVSREKNRANLLKGILAARKQFSIDCEITGLRTEEATGRGYLRRFGTFHFSKAENIWKCKPVLHWTGEDVWAYIISRNLPYLRWYDLEAPFVGYERARYSNWAGVYMAEQGRFVRLKHNYPEEYALLAKTFPEISVYT